MRVRISGKAAVTRRGKPATDEKTVKALHGVTSDNECADYLDPDLAALGIEGGKIQLIHDPNRGWLVVTEYTAPKKLTPKRLAQLADDTQGQWSDGLGVSCFAYEAKRAKADVDLFPFDQKVAAEQLADSDGVPKGGKAPNKQALAIAAQDGKLAEVRELLAAGADTEVMFQRHTPLLLAVGYGHKAVVKALIEAGAKVNARDPNGWDALVSCGMSNAVRDGVAAEIAQILLDHGAKPNGKRGREYYLKKSPLQAAHGKPKLQAVLKANGATA
ncbi:MAG TPA: ankyrin repeat domain-containing protein [Gemmataceae bacterium]|nr:ankyrin repeat domain-containing protein [Gemmataceae bacterium]